MIICRQLSQDRRWIDRMRRGMPLLVTAGGELLMHHCHSDDIGIAVAAAVGRSCCLGQTYILTSPHPITWREYHEQVAASLGYQVTLVDAPAELLIKFWPQNTGILTSDSRWNRIFKVDKLLRDIPEFQPKITLEEGMPDCIRWLEAHGILEDARADDTEDRIIASIDRLWEELLV